MILSLDLREIKALEPQQLIESILERRSDLREHRDQRGDARCFFDDHLVWRWVSGTPPIPTTYTKAWGMSKCTLFYQYRSSDTADRIPENTIQDPTHWNDDLKRMPVSGAVACLWMMQRVIWKHYRVSLQRPLTIEDDRELYTSLPEKIPADFRLGPRDHFLGETLAPHAGCPAFWRSHENCPNQTHDFHQWGPCQKV